MLFALSSLTAAMLQATNLWSMSKGHIPHLRLFITYVMYGGVELWLALRDPYQRWLLVFVVLDAWCATMAVVGMVRQFRLKYRA